MASHLASWPSPFFGYAPNTFPDIGSVGRVEKKTKKNHKKFWNRRPWYPRTALKVNFKYLDYQIAQYTVKTVHVFVPVFLNAVTMLTFQIKIIILSEKWVNYLVTTFFF